MDDETKDVTKDEKVRDVQQDTEQRDGEDHSVYDFIKEDGGIICAAGSALITILAFCLRLSSYLYHLAYLRYWDIDPNLIAEPENYWLENIVFSFFLVAADIVYMNLITNFSQKHAVENEFINRNSKEIKQIEKYRKHHQKRINRERKKLNKKRSTSSNPENEDSKGLLDLEESQLTELQKKSKLLKQKIIGLRKKHNRQHIFRLTICSVVLVATYYIYFLRTTYSSKEKLISSAVCVLMYLFSASFISKKSAKKKCAQLSDDELIEEINQSTSISDLLENPRKEIFTNTRIVHVVVTLVYYGLVFLIVQSYFGIHEAKQKKNFMIVQDSGSSYAVVASDSDYLIAEPIIINGNTAEIITDQKIVFSKENEPIIETVEFATPPKIKKEAKQ